MKVLITGGGGFLGSHLARRLLSRGDDVTVLGRSTYPQFDKSIHCVQVDIRDRDALTHALKGQEVVFHTVAIPGIWGDYNDFYQTDVVGTDNIIAACRAQNVKKLIYTSSPSVVFGQEDLEGVDESVPYPKTYLCHYPKTKAMAEQHVMRANGNRLATVCLRPHLIWGPGDPHLLPRLIERARRNKLIRVGDGTNRVDMIYIDNAVEAHVQACERLESDRGGIAGNCYFVSDGNPVVLWNWINDVLKKLGLPQAKRSVSFKTATILGAFLEGVYGLLRVKKEPPMTRFLAAQLATSHYFNISRARRDFGYNPVVSLEEGMDRLVEYFIRQEG
jgi:nucleoside-diphosphate-sugar epimerase